MKNKVKQLAQYKNQLLLILTITSVIGLTIHPALLALKSSNPQKTTKTASKLPEKTANISPTIKLGSPKIVLAAATQISQNPKPTINITPTKIPTPTPTNAPTTNQPVQNTPTNGQTEQLVAQPTPNIEPTATNTPTPTQTSKTVTLQIQLPNGTITITIPLNLNENACDILQEAKDENKITALTFDDSYLSMMHSRYVKEINGYQNNWTFTINGTSPLGCSLSTPQPNDTIIWKFN